MSRKPESTFKKSVNKWLPVEIYHQDMAGIYVSGTPDTYYEGYQRMMWIEYKWYPKMPRVMNLKAGKKPKLTALQYRWLCRARSNGLAVAVVVGSPQGALILPDPEFWMGDLQTRNFRHCIPREVAAWIVSILKNEEK